MALLRRLPQEVANPEVLDNLVHGEAEPLADDDAHCRSAAAPARDGRALADMRLLRRRPTVLLDGVDLRYLRIGGTELVRRVYAAVRDIDWDTVPGVVSGLEIEESDDSFRSSSTSAMHAARSTSPGTARSPGRCRSDRVRLRRVRRAAFPFGRIGLCVHHPWRETAGARFPQRVLPTARSMARSLT